MEWHKTDPYSKYAKHLGMQVCIFSTINVCENIYSIISEAELRSKYNVHDEDAVVLANVDLHPVSSERYLLTFEVEAISYALLSQLKQSIEQQNDFDFLR